MALDHAEGKFHVPVLYPWEIPPRRAHDVVKGSTHGDNARVDRRQGDSILLRQPFEPTHIPLQRACVLGRNGWNGSL